MEDIKPPEGFELIEQPRQPKRPDIDLSALTETGAPISPLIPEKARPNIFNQPGTEHLPPLEEPGFEARRKLIEPARPAPSVSMGLPADLTKEPRIRQPGGTRSQPILRAPTVAPSIPGMTLDQLTTPTAGQGTPPPEFTVAEEESTREKLKAVQEGTKKMGKFGAYLSAAIFETINPTSPVEYKIQLWEKVKQAGEEAPIEEVSNAAGLALLAYGGYDALKSIPDLLRQGKIVGEKTSDWIRNKLYRGSREVANISDEQLYQYYKNLPDEAKAITARANIRLREVIKAEESKVASAVKSEMAAPKSAVIPAVKTVATPAVQRVPPAPQQRAPIPTPTEIVPARPQFSRGTPSETVVSPAEPAVTPKPPAILEAEKHGKVVGIDAETKLPVIDTRQKAEVAPLKSVTTPATPVTTPEESVTTPRMVTGQDLSAKVWDSLPEAERQQRFFRNPRTGQLTAKGRELGMTEAEVIEPTAGAVSAPKPLTPEVKGIMQAEKPQFMGNLKAGDIWAEANQKITGNFKTKKEAERFAQETGAKVKGYLSGKYDRGWITHEPIKQPQIKPPKLRPEVPLSTTPPIEPKTPTIPADGGAQPPMGLNKAEIERIRKDTGLDQLEPPKRKKWVATLQKAKADGVDVNAVSLAEEVIKTRRPITDVEYAGMTHKAAQLMNEYDASVQTSADLIQKGELESAKIEAGRRSTIQDQIDKLTEASDMGGTEVARSLSIRRMKLNRDDYTPAAIVRQATVVHGKRLSPEKIAEFESLGKQYAEAEKRLQDALLESDKKQIEIDRLKAERIIKQEIIKTRVGQMATRQREKILTERQDIKKALAGLGMRLNDITGITAEGSYLVGRLGINYITEGAVDLNEVVKKVKADLPDLSTEDIYRALISRDPTRQIQARNDTAKRIGQLKTQARILLDIEKAEQGIFDPAKQKSEQAEPIRSLQKRLRDLRAQAYKTGLAPERIERSLRLINELQDQLANQYRTLKNRKPVENADLQSAKAKITELRKQMRVEDELTKLNDQMRTGKFEIQEKPKPKPIPPELERKQIELKSLRRKIKAAIDDMSPTTPAKVGIEVINTMRTLKATADMSMTFRQGLMLFARRPLTSSKAFVGGVKSFFSEYNADQIDNALRSDPKHYIREKSGLFLAEPDSKLTAREEFFQAKWIEKVPVLGQIIKASNRHATAFLNLQRVGAFDQFAEAYPNATQGELKAWANWVNVATGRGDLGKAAGAANALSLVIFSPRFAASRIQTPFMVFKNWKEPRVRKEIAKDYATVATIGGLVLALAAFAGFEVGLDPRSPDFGKIKIGNTRIDIWGGVQQPIRLITRIGMAVTDRVGLTGKDLTKSEKDFDPVEAIGRFAAFKLAPSVTVTRELLTGKTMVGEEVSPTESMANSVLPLMFNDVADAYKSGGAGTAALSGGLSFLGVGVGTYENTREVKHQMKMVKEGRLKLSDSEKRELYKRAQKVRQVEILSQKYRKAQDAKVRNEPYIEKLRKMMEDAEGR